MEVRKIAYALALAMAIMSCTKEETPQAEDSASAAPKAFSAVLESGFATRTHLDGNNIIWDASDEVAVFNTSTRLLRYGIMEGSIQGTSATIVCKEQNVCPDASLPTNVAYYPYADGITASPERNYVHLNVDLPSTQTYTPGGYDKKAFPMCAVTKTNDSFDLHFFNVMGLLKFRFKGENLNVRSITVKGNNGETLAGKATVSCAYMQNPYLSFDNSGESSVCLDCGSGVKLTADKTTDFFIALPPIVFSKGITVTIKTDDKIIEKSTTQPLAINRSAITPMDPLVPYTYVSSVSLDKSNASLARGHELQLYATVLPQEATVQTVTWTSSDTEVATVSESGIVKALKTGNATITATTVDGGKTASCDISVYVAVEKIDLDNSEMTVPLDGSKKITATISPDDASDKTVIWSSSDDSVATVSDGTITGVKEGSAVITVKSVQSGVSASCQVTVKRIAVTGINISRTRAELELMDGLSISANVIPEDASNQNISWEVENESILRLSFGSYRAYGTGTTMITAKSEDGGYTASCIVRVKQFGWDMYGIVYVNGVRMDKTSVKIAEGKTAALTATVSPSNASDKSLTWISSDPSVATVDGGTVTANKIGSCTVTCRTNDGYYTSECQVTVVDNIPVEAISLDKTDITLTAGEQETLNTFYQPSDATIRDLTWASSDKSVATVSNGVVTALYPGTATITATSVDGGKTASCKVTVLPRAVDSVSLNKTSLTIKEGSYETLIATINPTYATEKTVTWSSSDTEVATVDANGKVTGKDEGSAVITVTTKDGGKTATCLVTVTGANSIGEGGDIITPKSVK